MRLPADEKRECLCGHVFVERGVRGRALWPIQSAAGENGDTTVREGMYD